MEGGDSSLKKMGEDLERTVILVTEMKSTTDK